MVNNHEILNIVNIIILNFYRYKINELEKQCNIKSFLNEYFNG